MVGNGAIIPNTPIAVDFWRIQKTPHVRLFFCSHCHSDHTDGLTSSWHLPMYCSAVTKRILMQKFGIKSRYMTALEMDTPHIIPMDAKCTTYMNVTLIDANHCPGSVMFIFQGYFGRVLYTADFRFSPSMLSNPFLTGHCNPFDVLYLDNTYCDKRCQFPDRETAKEEIIKIIAKQRIETPDCRVMIGVRKLGKEDLLEDLGEHFKSHIIVDGESYAQMEVLRRKNVFSRNSDEGFIHAIQQHQLTTTKVRKLNEECPTIAILPTALYCGLDVHPYANNDSVFVVLYSDHSSYAELVKFVKSVRPKKVLPIVSRKTRGPLGCDVSSRADMSCFSSYLNPEPLREIILPEEVKKILSGKTPYPDPPPSTCITALNRQKFQKRQPKRKRPVKGVVYDTQEKGTSDRASLANSLHITVNIQSGRIGDRMEMPGPGFNVASLEVGSRDVFNFKGATDPEGVTESNASRKSMKRKLDDLVNSRPTKRQRAENTDTICEVPEVQGRSQSTMDAFIRTGSPVTDGKGHKMAESIVDFVEEKKNRGKTKPVEEDDCTCIIQEDVTRKVKTLFACSAEENCSDCEPNSDCEIVDYEPPKVRNFTKIKREECWENVVEVIDFCEEIDSVNSENLNARKEMNSHEENVEAVLVHEENVDAMLVHEGNVDAMLVHEKEDIVLIESFIEKDKNATENDKNVTENDKNATENDKNSTVNDKNATENERNGTRKAQKQMKNKQDGHKSERKRVKQSEKKSGKTELEKVGNSKKQVETEKNTKIVNIESKTKTKKQNSGNDSLLFSLLNVPSPDKNQESRKKLSNTCDTQSKQSEVSIQAQSEDKSSPQKICRKENQSDGIDLIRIQCIAGNYRGHFQNKESESEKSKSGNIDGNSKRSDVEIVTPMKEKERGSGVDRERLISHDAETGEPQSNRTEKTAENCRNSLVIAESLCGLDEDHMCGTISRMSEDISAERSGSASECTLSEGSKSERTQSSGSKSERTHSAGSKSERTQRSGSKSKRTQSTGSKNERTQSSGCKSKCTQSTGSQNERTQSSGSASGCTHSAGSKSERTQSSGSKRKRTQSSGSASESTFSSGSKSMHTQSSGSKSVRTQSSEPQKEQTQSSGSKSERTQSSESKNKLTQNSGSKSKRTQSSRSKTVRTQSSESPKDQTQSSVKYTPARSRVISVKRKNVKSKGSPFRVIPIRRTLHSEN